MNLSVPTWLSVCNDLICVALLNLLWKQKPFKEIVDKSSVKQTHVSSDGLTNRCKSFWTKRKSSSPVNWTKCGTICCSPRTKSNIFHQHENQMPAQNVYVLRRMDKCICGGLFVIVWLRRDGQWINWNWTGRERTICQMISDQKKSQWNFSIFFFFKFFFLVK